MRWVVVLLAAAVATVAAASPIILDSPYADGGGLPAKPMRPCVGGEVTRVSSTNPNLNVDTIRIAVAGESASIGVPGFGGGFLVCLDRKFRASTRQYDMTVKGISRMGAVIVTQIVRGVSFTHGLVFDGQSNMMLPVAVSAPFAGDLILTNYTRIVQEWAAMGFYGVTFMQTPSVGAAAFSATPRNTFPAISLNWTRFDAPNFASLLVNAIGWQAATECMEFARRHGPSHCAQNAVATTSLKPHMPNETYATSGMISPKPYTSAASEPLQSPGGLWNGAKTPLLRWQPKLWSFAQGEADWATPAEYGVSLLRFYDALERELNAVRAMVDYSKKENENEMTYTQFCDHSLHSYEGRSTTPPSQNPPFNGTALVKNVLKGRARMCRVVKSDLGFFTKRDGGLHHPDTYFNSAIRAIDCYENLVSGASRVVEGPKLSSHGLVTAFDTTTGQVSIELTFDTPVQFAPVPRPAAIASKVWQYSQFNGAQFAFGVAQAPVVVTSGRTLTLTFVTEQPAIGPPTTLVYTILSDFLKDAILAMPDTVAPNPHWNHPAPLPADPFSVTLVRSPTIVITSSALPATPTAPFTAAPRMIISGRSGDYDPEWTDVVDLQATA